MPIDKREMNTTEKEITFLRGIMNNAHTPRQRTPSVIRMTIQSYIATIDKRRWDEGVDVAAVRRYAMGLLV